MNVTDRARWFVLAVLVFLAVGGCNKRSAPASAFGLKSLPVSKVKAENDWPLYEVPAEGFAVALPPDWVHMEVSSQNMDEMIAKLVTANPALASFGESFRKQVRSGIKFFGFDKQAAATGSGTNVTIAKAMLPAGATLASITDLNVGQIQSVFKLTSAIDREPKTTPHLGAERIRFSFQMAGLDGRPTNLAIVQYYYVTDKVYFVLGLTTTADQADQNADIANSIGDSFRVLKKE